MGNIEESRNRVRVTLKGDKGIWLIILSLSLISLLAVYSSSNSLAYMNNESTHAYLFRQAAFMVLGLGVLYSAYRIPLGLYRLLAYPLLIISILLLIYTAVAGETINGAKRWIKLFGFTIHTSEIAKVSLVLYLAKITESVTFDSFKKFFLLITLPLGIIVLLVLYGSVSTALFLSLISFVILIFARVKWSYLFKTALITLALITFVVVLHKQFGLFPRVETAISRVERFLPKSNNETVEMTAEELQRKRDKDHQSKMARIAVSSAGIRAKGPGKSTQKDLLPHPYSDFIYAIIVEEWGLIGGVVVLILYLWFFARAIVIAQKCQTQFAILLVLGIAASITGQAMLHIFVNLDILPVTGHTLPLISLGGTSLMIMGLSFGLILAVSRTVDRDIAQNNLNEEEDGYQL